MHVISVTCRCGTNNGHEGQLSRRFYASYEDNRAADGDAVPADGLDDPLVRHWPALHDLARRDVELAILDEA